MGLYAKAGAVLRAELTRALDLSTPKDILELVASIDFADGSGSGQANVNFHDQRSLDASNLEDLDLAGSLTDPFGRTITFTAVKALLIYNTSTTQTLSVGGAASNQFINWVANVSDIINIPPGGFIFLTAPASGFAVTAATGDLLRIANSAGAACTYRIGIIGVGSVA